MTNKQIVLEAMLEDLENIRHDLMGEINIFSNKKQENHYLFCTVNELNKAIDNIKVLIKLEEKE